MSRDLYYTAPSDSIFEEIKQAATEIWQTYDNDYGYVDEKLSVITPLKNIKDNYMLMVSMFDSINQEKLFSKLSVEARLLIKEALR